MRVCWARRGVDVDTHSIDALVLARWLRIPSKVFAANSMESCSQPPPSLDMEELRWWSVGLQAGVLVGAGTWTIRWPTCLRPNAVLTVFEAGRTRGSRGRSSAAEVMLLE